MIEEDTPQAIAAPRLLDQVRDEIRRRHYSYRTEQTYVHWIKRFIYFSGKRHPRAAARHVEEIEGFARQRTRAGACASCAPGRATQSSEIR